MNVELPPRPKASSPTVHIDYSDSQVPFSAPPFYADPEYPIDSYRISKPRGVTPLVTVSAINGALLEARKFRV